MRLKSFYAKTMSEAMQMVRDTLGEDAVIVATREEKGGKAVRVTAAIDPSSYGEPAFEIGRGAASQAAPASDWLQYDEEDEEFAVAEELTEVMLRHAVPETVMDQVLSCATVIGLEQPAIALVASLEHLFHFRPLPLRSYKKPMMLIGPPGAGKTLVAAKMAARGAMNGLNIGVITADTVRAGGVEQLAAFTKLLRIDLQKAKTPQDLLAALSDLRGCDQVIIDSPGINPFDTEDIRTLARLIGADDIEPYLVLPAGGDADEAGEMARAFAALGAHTLVPTRVDITRRLGGLLAAAYYGNLAFADAGNTAKVADGLISLTPQTLSKLLMPAAGSGLREGRAVRTGTS
jgi:flagellar biosynthesis protein FlhF